MHTQLIKICKLIISTYIVALAYSHAHMVDVVNTSIHEVYAYIIL